MMRVDRDFYAYGLSLALGELESTCLLTHH